MSPRNFNFVLNLVQNDGFSASNFTLLNNSFATTVKFSDDCSTALNLREGGCGGSDGEIGSCPPPLLQCY